MRPRRAGRARQPGRMSEKGRKPDVALIIALTPSRDPTALQEAGDAFAKSVTRLSGVPIRAQVASDFR